MSSPDAFHGQQGSRDNESSSDQRRGGGGWLSFNALFGDGDRTVRKNPSSFSASPISTPSLPVPAEDSQDALRDNAGSEGHFDMDAIDEEIADLRMEIRDMNEVLRHHDLWVQDAHTMRAEVVQLRQGFDEHKVWLENITGLLRYSKARELVLAHQVAGLTRKVAQLENHIVASPGSNQDSCAVSVTSFSLSQVCDGLSPGMKHALQNAKIEERSANHEPCLNMAFDGDALQMSDLTYSGLSLKAQGVDLSLRSQLSDLESSLKDQLQADQIKWRTEMVTLLDSLENLSRCFACENSDVCTAARAPDGRALDLLTPCEPGSVRLSGTLIAPGPSCDFTEETLSLIGDTKDDRCRMEEADCFETGRLVEIFSRDRS